MAEEPLTLTPTLPPQGYARAATSGTRWTTAQGVLNKIATAASMLVVAQALTQDEFGLASTVIATSGLVMFLPVIVMGDVLITHQHHAATVHHAARRITAIAAIASAGVMMLAAPLISLWYVQYAFILMTALLAVTGVRQIADAFSVFPLTRLRMALRYREIAVISGTTQLSGALLTVIWALMWPSAAAIVVPPVLAMIARAMGFAISARKLPSVDPVPIARLEDRRPELPRGIAKRLRGEFGLAAAAQYVHTVLTWLPLVVTSLYVSKTEMGEFGLAFTIAVQASSLLSQQLGTVLQPIFGRLRSDSTRQLAGFMRVVALMSAIAAPLSLLQAAMAEPLFVLFFGERWLPAVPVFIAFSLTQVFYFLTAPVMALLKAQGRFGTYFVWQVSQALVSLAVFPLAASAWGGPGVAFANTTIWLACVPMVIWIGSQGSGVRGPALVWSLLSTWLTAVPIAIGAWLLWQALPFPPIISAAIAVFGIGPMAMLLSLLAIRLTQPGVAMEIAPAMRRILRRIPGLGAPLAAWFAPAR